MATTAPHDGTVLDAERGVQPNTTVVIPMDDVSGLGRPDAIKAVYQDGGERLGVRA